MGTFTVIPNPGYTVTMGGTCPSGSFVGPVYTTGAIFAPCTVVATFQAPVIQVAAPNEALGVILDFAVPKTLGIVGTGPSLAPFGVAKPNPGEPFVLPPMGSGHRRGSDTQLAQHINFVNLGLF